MKTPRLLPYLFLLPAALIYGTFLLFPLLQVGVMSLWHWNGLTPHFDWVGLQNYFTLLSDGEVWQAAGNNIRWVILAIVPIAAGLGLAVLLDQGRPRGRSVYRGIYFLPYVMPIVISAIVWGWIYHPSWGPLNAVLRAVGWGNAVPTWLGDQNIALVSLAMAANWTGYGFCMMLFLAGLSSIDRTLYDAARVDGANAWQQFRHVTLPGLANTVNLVVLIVFINTVRVFDFVFLTTNGGPAGATEVLGTKIFRETFQNLDIGYGSAVAVLMALLILGTSVIYLRLREREG